MDERKSPNVTWGLTIKICAALTEPCRLAVVEPPLLPMSAAGVVECSIRSSVKAHVKANKMSKTKFEFLKFSGAVEIN